jgi:dsDNA-specific endonuclease/ATPase MutS2
MPRHTAKRKAGRKHKKSHTMKRHHKGGFFGPFKKYTDAASTTISGVTKKVTEHPKVQAAHEKISDSTRKVLNHPAVLVGASVAKKQTEKMTNALQTHAQTVVEHSQKTISAIQSGATQAASTAASKAAEANKNMKVVADQLQAHAANLGGQAKEVISGHVENVKSIVANHVCPSMYGQI